MHALSTHILIKLGIPIALFFIVILASDFYYLKQSIEQSQQHHLLENSRIATEVIEQDLQQETDFIRQFLRTVEQDGQLDAKTLSAQLMYIYGNSENSIQTIKNLYIWYQPSNTNPPPFYCAPVLA